MTPARARFRPPGRGRALGVGLLVVGAAAVAGCGEPAPSTSWSQADLDASVTKALRTIALDGSVPDEETLKRYLARMPDKPTVFPDDAPWARVEPDGEGFRIVVRRLDRVFLARRGSAPRVDPLQIERDGIQGTARFCEQLLTDLAPRHLTSIRVTLVGSTREGPDGRPAYVDLLELTATPAHLPALSKARGPATKGSEFDPRADGFGSLFAIHVNRYPELTYTVRR